MIKLKATVSFNRIPPLYNIDDDFYKAQQYFFAHGIDITFSYFRTDVKGYTSVSTQIPLDGQRWILQGAEKLITIDPLADINIFVFDEAEWATPVGSPFPLLGNTPTGSTFLLNNKPFINIASYIVDHNNGQTAIQIQHEVMHALVKMANTTGFIIQDVMDTYTLNSAPSEPSSNFSQQWKLLAPYLAHLNIPNYTYFNPTQDPLMIGVSPTLMAIADKARGLAKVPFHITSGLRTVSQNQAAGGVANSSHLTGKALDLLCNNNTVRTKMLFGLLTCGSPLFIEIAPTHIHIDFAGDIHPLGDTMVSTLQD